MTNSASVDLRGREGAVLGTLTLECLDGREVWGELPAIAFVDSNGAIGVGLLEETTYEYAIDWEANTGDLARLEPVELFSFAGDRARGRFSTGRSTGTIMIRVSSASGAVLTGLVEVRSRKLGWETDYRSMLTRISREAAELVQATFAPSELSAFGPQPGDDAETLYQRFIFIEALIASDEVQAALSQINRNPHVNYIEHHREVDPSQSVRASSSLAREMAKAGPRQRVARPIAGLDVLPLRIDEVTTAVSTDTVPNRFVRYVLERWGSVVGELRDALSAPSAAHHRGRDQATAVLDELDRALSLSPLVDAGRLDSFPSSNQVLQGRAGYSELLEAFLLAEAASIVSWDDGSRVFSGGQRNVAELYEYWVFLELVRIIGVIPGCSVTRRELVRKSRDGVSLELRRSGSAVVTATCHRRGRDLTLRLYFNRSFSSGTEPRSWTVKLRPDCSVIVQSNSPGFAPRSIHFDAKYRFDGPDSWSSAEAEGESGDAGADAGDGAARQRRGEMPLNSDLAKMHAYRDAIIGTAGAYVAYPGSDADAPGLRQAYHEILPGLGAFALRPTEDGSASAEATLGVARFIEDALDHLAASGTADERARFWESRSYADRTTVRADWDSLLVRPAADTSVLLGFVRSAAHLQWMKERLLYPLRGDAGRRGAVSVHAPELAADLVVLYDAAAPEAWVARPTGTVEVWSADELRRSGYPRPGGERYFVLVLDDLSRHVGLRGKDLRRAARAGRTRDDWAAPLLTTWSRIGRPRAYEAREQ